ncbi:MAG: DUF1972 domain-containing protein [Coriobacteriia bacterium]|nr:DUF1972 domain-containing protein [Coriobacteriia bacterium]
MKNIYIIGSRGYHVNYGGWETFTSRLVDHYNDPNTHFYVTQLTHNKKDTYTDSDKVTVIPIYTPRIGGATMFLHTIRAFKTCMKIAEEGEIFYVLGLKLYNRLKRKKRKLEKLGVKVFVNPDGMEWQRSKWGKQVKKFFLKSEKLMLNNADTIICDAKGIKSYIDRKYKHLKDKTRYIPYGFETYKLNNEKEVLKEHELKKDNYCLVVGRCEPENNFELIIKAFMKSKIDKQLVIITNFSESSYYKDLVESTKYMSDPRIKFIDGVYDKEKLACIRKNAYMYIHGHSVGGTNPSLIEALSLTDVNVLYNVSFNRDIGQKTCLYFKSIKDLTKILDNDIDKSLGKEAKKLAKANYTWDKIVDQYKAVFNEA